MSRAARCAAVGAAIALTSGCYRYVVLADQSSVAAGERVRVELTDAGSEFVRGAMGSTALALDGDVIAWRADTVILDVRRARMRSGEFYEWTGLRVLFPTSAVERVERREFSRSRSVILGAGATAAAALVIMEAIDAAGGGTPGGGGPPPPQP
jgi:hypothetical protein